MATNEGDPMAMGKVGHKMAAGWLSEDTVVDFDDMSHSVPGWSLGANIAEV